MPAGTDSEDSTSASADSNRGSNQRAAGSGSDEPSVMAATKTLPPEVAGYGDLALFAFAFLGSLIVRAVQRITRQRTL
jgi:hypothetical protein